MTRAWCVLGALAVTVLGAFGPIAFGASSDDPQGLAPISDEWRVREGVCAAFGNEAFLCPALKTGNRSVELKRRLAARVSVSAANARAL
ncbi:MAG: hypothetical protein IPG50_20265 [Myxococcales bacterium]|nr:hypothetical protein [Myxococcales bacterium]